MDRIGRYKIERELGRGAMGVVYHAIDPNIGRPVAIKTIRLAEVGNTQERARLRERLFREARSAGILSHPGIVTIYDVEQQGDLAYIAMEFVDGRTLDDVLADSQPLTPARMFSVLGQTAVALDYAHQKGIVHRDIKPANIMIAADGSVKITDFGIAKITASEQFTMTGTIVGTPHYMSPEQVQGLAVDGRADQFSLAVIVFEMLTGEKPFTGEQLTTVVYKIVAEEPPHIQQFNATLNQHIEGALRKALSKKPDLRYKNCEEFIDAMEAACAAARSWKPLARGASHSEPTLAAAASSPVLPPARSPRASTTIDEARRRRVPVLPLLLAVLVAVGLVGLIAWQAAPWIANNGTKQPAESSAPAPAPKPPAAADMSQPSAMPPSAATPPAAAPATETAAAAAPDHPAAQEPPPAPKPAEPEAAPAPKPSPAAKVIPPEPEQEQPAEPVRRPAARGTFAVLVPTHPPGATVTLDGRPETACKAPCSIQAAVGRHSVSIAMPGYHTEQRQVNVTGTPLELPLVSLRTAEGTLMLSTAPAGASIFIDGKPSNQTTPAQISLAPGTYTVTVVKGEQRVSERVEIRSGGTTFRKIPLPQ